MERVETILGREDKSREYRELYEQIREEFRKRYCLPDGALTQRSQTAYLLALMAGLLPKERENEALSLLIDKIRDNGYRLSTGFVGTGILMETLSRFGRFDMAYNLLMQRENPSWLYSVDQGATTVWERWDSYTLAKGFGSAGMNSFNHYAYGCVGEWMYRHMAGIDCSDEHPGFEEVILQPRPDIRDFLPPGEERVTFVKAAYKSRNGLIEAEWKLEDGGYLYRVSLEDGMKAVLRLPVLSCRCRIFKAECQQQDGVEVHPPLEKECGVFRLEGGKHVFRVIPDKS